MLTITEVPGGSTVDIAIGKVALAVVKERMKPGETIDIRTPNAVAGIRGTVVITEVEQATAQAGPVTGGAFTTTFIVPRGVVHVSQIDPQTLRAFGPGVTLGALQTTRITGATDLRPAQTLTPEAVQRLSTDYKLKVTEAPGAAATNASLAKTQIQQAVTHVSALPTVTAPR
ncbi:MAG: hypothetical protein HYS77_11450, partial [Candidatus Rokubacteria bacterium]|nr:hypothetical protein [Candidatus Rokubacteria bacterium]